MTAKVTLDRAGRVVFPKPLREELRLSAGDTLHLESEGGRITLLPARTKPALRKEHGVWVYPGEAGGASIPEVIGRQREKRLRELMG